MNLATTSDRQGTRNHGSQPRLGFGYPHVVIDDYFRVAYVEICDDEKAHPARWPEESSFTTTTDMIPASGIAHQRIQLPPGHHS